MKNSLFIERRLGRLKISREMLRENVDTFLEKVSPRIVVVDVEHRFFEHGSEFIAYSPEFEPVHEGENIPVYELEINNIEKDGQYELAIKFVKVHG
jgi:hypothetical protein